MESIYKIDTGSDHVAKFRGDRPRELGDLAAIKKKHHEHFIRPPVTTVPGGLTSPARLAQLLQPSLTFCFSLQPMTAYSCASLAGFVVSFIACFILLVIDP